MFLFNYVVTNSFWNIKDHTSISCTMKCNTIERVVAAKSLKQGLWASADDMLNHTQTADSIVEVIFHCAQASADLQ